MLLYMIKSSAGNYLKSYVQNGNDTFTDFSHGQKYLRPLQKLVEQSSSLS